MKITAFRQYKNTNNFNNPKNQKTINNKSQIGFGYGLIGLDEDKFLKDFENDHKTPIEQHSFLYRYLDRDYGFLRQIIDPKDTWQERKMPWNEVNVDVEMLFAPQYKIVLSKEKNERDNKRLQELFNEDVQRTKDKFKLDSKRYADADYEKLCKKCILASCTNAFDKKEFERYSMYSTYWFGEIIGHAEEKYELLRDVLSPIRLRKKSAEYANEPRIFANTNINTQYQYIAMKKFVPIPNGVLLYGSSDKEALAKAVFNQLPDMNRVEIGEISAENFKNKMATIFWEQKCISSRHTLVFMKDSSCIKDKNHPLHDELLNFMEKSGEKGVTFVFTADKIDEIDPEFLKDNVLDKAVEVKKLEKTEIADVLYNNLAFRAGMGIRSYNCGNVFEKNRACNAALELANTITENNWDLSQKDIGQIISDLSSRNKDFDEMALNKAVKEFCAPQKTECAKPEKPNFFQKLSSKFKKT